MSSWATGDTCDYQKLRQKTTTVASNKYLSLISDTYAGQAIYCTTTKGVGDQFTKDHLYRRNTANTVWGSPDIVESAELSTGNTSTASSLAVTANQRYFSYFTFPTVNGAVPTMVGITGLEYNISSLVGGTVYMGIDVVNANPPTVNSSILVCLTQSFNAASGVNRFVSVHLTPKIFKTSGITFGAWILCTSANTLFGSTTASQNSVKNTGDLYTSGIKFADNTAFSLGTFNPYIKIYYKTYT